jgi:hypothetical protein
MGHISFWLMLMMEIYWEKVVGTIRKSAETLIDASREIGLEINVEKTKYMLLARHQNAGQNWEIKIANRQIDCLKMCLSSNVWEQQ